MSSLDFELRHPRSKLRAVARACLLQHVRDVTLDRLPRQEQLLGNFGIAGAFGDQTRDRILALRQGGAAAGAATPRSDAERAQPLLGNCDDRLRTALLREPRHPVENLFGARAIGRCKGRAEIETRPQRVEDEAEFFRFTRCGLQQLGGNGLAQERLDASLYVPIAWLGPGLHPHPFRE